MSKYQKVLVAGVLVVGGGALYAQSIQVRVNPNIRINASSFRTSDDRPGPDSAQVATMFAALERSDPAICEMTVDMLGNWWGGSSARSVGRLSDVRDDGALRKRITANADDLDAARGLVLTRAERHPGIDHDRADSKRFGRTARRPRIPGPRPGR